MMLTKDSLILLTQESHASGQLPGHWHCGRNNIDFCVTLGWLVFELCDVFEPGDDTRLRVIEREALKKLRV